MPPLSGSHTYTPLKGNIYKYAMYLQVHKLHFSHYYIFAKKKYFPLPMEWSSHQQDFRTVQSYKLHQQK